MNVRDVCDPTAPFSQQRLLVDAAWTALLAAAALTAELEGDARHRLFGLDEGGKLQSLTTDGPDVALAWVPNSGWQSRLSAPDARAELLDLYLPICTASVAHPVTVGHLGQSLDGFIATHAGESQFVTGDDNIIHLHRMRALSDAVVVGAGTVAADDPQLTTRHVTGPNPLRVILDPARRLPPSLRVFCDEAAPTLYMCAKSQVAPGERVVGNAEIVGFEGDTPAEGAASVLRLLHVRGCARVFIEGGGVTVSRFLEANLLDRLQIAIAPVIIGDGRPAIRLAPHARLRDCRRPDYRVFRMGGDVLFDCQLGGDAETQQTPRPGSIARVI